MPDEPRPTAQQIVRAQVDEFHRTAAEIFARQIAEFERIFSRIPPQAKEGK